MNNEIFSCLEHNLKSTLENLMNIKLNPLKRKALLILNRLQENHFQKVSYIANGPGLRVSLFVSGCTHHCKGCFNPESWDFNYGQPFTEATEAKLLKLLENEHIRGLSLLGGEPFEPANQAVLVKFLRVVKQKFPKKDVWCYSGYNFEKDMLTGNLGLWEITEEMLSYIDVLVDGEFVLELKDPTLRFRGSQNQRIINVQESLKQDTIIPWDDGEGERI